MVIQHKCPNCGADLAFNAESGMLHCDSCGYDTVIDNKNDAAEAAKNNFDEFVNTTSQQTYGDDGAAQYQCRNCGAVLITTQETTATTCSFCDAPMILGDRLIGQLAPSKVVPFSITKQQAEEAFRKWCGSGFKKLVLPAAFQKANRIKSVTGMYIPFWLFDMSTKGEIHAECTKETRHHHGNDETIETKYYDVYRQAFLSFQKIPVDASKKMDDGMMDKLEPFDYSNLHDFNTPYLAGYLAEKYDYTDKDLYPRVHKRSEDYTLDYLRDSIIGYNSTKIMHKNIQVRQDDAKYTLLPIWMFCYDYEHSEHNFFMNGQTGKIVGKPPISPGRSVLWFSIFFIVIFTLIKILMFLIGGVWF